MDKLVGVVSTAPKTRSKNDDDFADRLSSRYTVVLLIAFAGLVGIIEVCLWIAISRRVGSNYLSVACVCILPPAVLILQPPSSGTHSHLAFATLPVTHAHFLSLTFG